VAIAVPVSGTLTAAESFFIAHGAGPTVVLVVLAVVLLVPPTAVWLGVEVVAARSSRQARAAVAVGVGGLLALALAGALDQSVSLPLAAYGAVFVAATAGIGLAYGRLAMGRTFVGVLGVPALLVFATTTLAAPSLRGPAAASTPGAGGGAAASGAGDVPSVAFVVLDELPLGAILTPDGEIDAVRFPGFGRLATAATWYRGATTVAPKTTAAVPAILAGTFPRAAVDDEPPATAAAYPANLFSLLSESHVVDATEWVTELCVPTPCSSTGAPAGLAAPGVFVDDLSILVQHELLPRRWVAGHVPDLAGRWAGFGSDGGTMASRVEGRNLEAALERLGATQTPFLWFVHERLPHRPTSVLPDGRTYLRGLPFDYYAAQRSHGSAPLRQQFLLQVGYVDSLIGRLLDRLQATGRFDSTLLVVVSDHGLSFRPDGHPRALTGDDPGALDDVLPVPLFVKYPGQRVGAVDPRRIQTVDLLPTVLDVVGSDAEPALDGRSLLDPAAGSGPWYWQPEGEVEADWISARDATSFARQTAELVGTGHRSLYALGPHASLLGAEVPTDPAESGAAVTLVGSERYRATDAAAVEVPALLEAEVDGLDPGTWVAVAVGGRVAGLSPVTTDGAGRPIITAMLDPARLTDGPVEPSVFVVGPDGELLSTDLR
jgi:hypothetical protein